MDFASKNAIVTGAARGIGLAIASKLLEKGSKVLLTDINLANAKDAYAKLKDKYDTRVQYADFSCDITSINNIKEAFDVCECELGKPNLLINNAGCVIEKSLKSSISLLLEAPINSTEFAIEYMGKHNGGKGGNVINVASITGVIADAPYTPYYSAAKAGVAVFTKNIGHPIHFEHTGVQVQCLCPGTVDTPLLPLAEAAMRRDPPKLIEYFENVKSTAPLMKTEEVASACIVLLEEGKPGAIMCSVYGRSPFYHETE